MALASLPLHVASTAVVASTASLAGRPLNSTRANAIPHRAKPMPAAKRGLRLVASDGSHSAPLAGCTYVGGVERWERIPALTSITPIADALGIRASELIA